MRITILVLTFTLIFGVGFASAQITLPLCQDCCRLN